MKLAYTDLILQKRYGTVILVTLWNSNTVNIQIVGVCARVCVGVRARVYVGVCERVELCTRSF